MPESKQLKLPKSLLVGNLKFSIEQGDADVNATAVAMLAEPENVRAATDLSTEQIFMRPEGTYGNGVTRQTLAHELVHCLLHGIDMGLPHDENFVHDMAKLLTQVLRDNPKVVAYLASPR